VNDTCSSCGQPSFDPSIVVTVEPDYVSLELDGLELLKVYGKNEQGLWKIDAKVGYLSHHTEGFMKPMTLPETFCEVCKR